MKRTVLTLASAILLAGCGSTFKREPEVRTVEVRVPVREACVPADLAGPGAYADAVLTSATPPDERYRLTAQANQQRKARLARIEPVIAACR